MPTRYLTSSTQRKKVSSYHILPDMRSQKLKFCHLQFSMLWMNISLYIRVKYDRIFWSCAKTECLRWHWLAPQVLVDHIFEHIGTVSDQGKSIHSISGRLMNVSKNDSGLLFSIPSQGSLRPIKSAEAFTSTVYTIGEVIAWKLKDSSMENLTFVPHQALPGWGSSLAPIGPLVPIESASNITGSSGASILEGI